MPERPRTAFIKAATWHGTLAEAEKWLASHPWLAASDIHTAAITGDVEAVRSSWQRIRTMPWPFPSLTAAMPWYIYAYLNTCVSTKIGATTFAGCYRNGDRLNR